MTRLFVFDLGNVILPFEHRQIGTKLCERSKKRLDLSPEEIFDYMFNRGIGLINTYETGQMSSIQFFSQLREQFGLSITFEEFKDIWNPIFWENARVIEAIEYLKSKGYPLFLLSDTNELHFAHIIEHYPIVHAFDEWILSFEVGAKKPEKRIYEVIFEKMDVDRSEVFYIDDLEKNVAAARSMGMEAMLFRDAEQLWQTIREKGI
jgi:glucose-1-phosphatase